MQACTVFVRVKPKDIISTDVTNFGQPYNVIDVGVITS